MTDRIDEIRAAVERARAAACAWQQIPSAIDMVLRDRGIAAQQYLLAELDRRVVETVALRERVRRLELAGRYMASVLLDHATGHRRRDYAAERILEGVETDDDVRVLEEQ
ncbi:MAG: hypothetical protein IT379_37375 [Deltaproteobacteria bacterium]|nr:hypothetical protein [Deltaproteobacteria bacterium]